MNTSLELCENKEIDYINIAKALGVILIVAGHAAEPSLFNTFINLFHIPLFFFISGYLFKDAYLLKPLNFFEKKLRGLYFPFIKYQILFLILHNIFLKLNFYNQLAVPYYAFADFYLNSLNIITFGESEIMGSALWFLASLFMANAIFFILSYALYSNKPNDKKNELLRFISVFIIFAAGILLINENIEVAKRINGALVAMPILYLGYLYRKIEKKIEKYKLLNYKITLLFFFLLVFNALTVKIETSAFIDQYPNPVSYILFSLLGIYCIFYISKLTEKTSANKILRCIGRNTIPIIALHFLSFKIINIMLIIVYELPVTDLSARAIKDPYYLLTIFYLVIGVLFPLMLMTIKNKTWVFAQEKLTSLTKN